uniref:Glycine N-acyltransferase-like protein n=1 Tax=Pelodiscus sinensis TaxID=13735 RepID=K7F336_PELSI
QVHGAVMNINRGNPAGHEVLVDSWPQFKAVITRPCREVASDNSDFYTNMYAAFPDLGAYQALLGSAGAINWSQTFCIYGLQDGVYKTSRDIAKDKGLQLEAYKYFTYLHPEPSTMPEIRDMTALRPPALVGRDSTMRLSFLDISHTNLLNETWPYGGTKQSWQYLANLVLYFPSFCLLNASSHPVSWSLLDPFGAMVHGYTLPQYRGRGYMQVVITETAKQMHAQGYPIYDLVEPENQPIQKLQESQGFQRQPSLSHCLIHTPG